MKFKTEIKTIDKLNGNDNWCIIDGKMYRAIETGRTILHNHLYAKFMRINIDGIKVSMKITDTNKKICCIDWSD